MNDENRKPKELLDWLGLRAMPDFSKARWIGAGVSFMLTLLFLLALGAAVLVIVHTIGQARKPDAEGPNLGAGALIAALLGAPFLIWATVIKQTTLNFQKEGHITDRISKAVEQLGAEKTVKVRGKDGDDKDITIEETKPNIEVRIGAILSLERIAQDSTRYDNGRDHVRVMEILCAYVRENSNARKPKNSLRQDWDREQENWNDDPDRFELWFCGEYGITPTDLKEVLGIDALQRWARGLTGPRADVMQAMLVIGRRTAQQRRVEAAWPDPSGDNTIWPFDQFLQHLPDVFGNAALPKAELDAFRQHLDAWKQNIADYKGYRLNLTGANLQGADLASKRPDATDAVFAGALLTDARMEGASLWQARTEGADLRNARVEGANLSQARMDGANLFGSRMEGANLRHAWMAAADLSFARVEGANLLRARMQGASLWGARMERADLSFARLEGANLEGAWMSNAELGWSRMDALTFLGGAKFAGAALGNGNFTEARLTQAQINSMFGDASVILPEGMDRPAHWPVWALPFFDDPNFDTELEKWRADPAGYVPPPPPADAAE